MNISTQLFELANARCSCCNQQGALHFATCANCKTVILICDEVGTVYLDPNDLEQAIYAGLDDPNCFCSVCSKTLVSNFVSSVEDEVKSVGFKSFQYKKCT